MGKAKGWESNERSNTEGRTALSREWKVLEERLTRCYCGARRLPVRMYLGQSCCGRCGKLAP